MKRVFTISYRLSQYKRLFKKHMQLDTKRCKDHVIANGSLGYPNVKVEGVLVDVEGKQMDIEARKDNEMDIKESKENNEHLKINLEEDQLQFYFEGPQINRLIADNLIGKRFKDNSNDEESSGECIGKSKADEISKSKLKSELSQSENCCYSIELNDSFSKSQNEAQHGKSDFYLCTENNKNLQSSGRKNGLQHVDRVKNEDLDSNSPIKYLQHSRLDNNTVESSSNLKSFDATSISTEDLFFEAPNSFTEDDRNKAIVKPQSQRSDLAINTSKPTEAGCPKKHVGEDQIAAVNGSPANSEICSSVNNTATMVQINNKLIEELDDKCLANDSINVSTSVGIRNYAFASSDLNELKELRQDLGHLSSSVKLIEESLENHKEGLLGYLKKSLEGFMEDSGKDQENRINLMKNDMMRLVLNCSDQLRSLLNSIEVDQVLECVEQLNKRRSESISSLEEELKSKEHRLNSLNEAQESLKIRAAIQEDQIDYLSRINDAFRTKDAKTTELIDILREVCPNLSRRMLSIEQNVGGLREAFSRLKSHNSDVISKFQLEFCSIKNRVDAATQALDLDGVLASAKSSLLRYFDDVTQGYSFQVESLQKSNIDLESRAQELKCEISDLKSKNNSLLESNKFIMEEVELKSQYSKEMENTVDEMMRANRFYEDQLLKSDELLRVLKEKQLKMSLDYARQVEKMRTEFLKENGILKLRIEEMELEADK